MTLYLTRGARLGPYVLERELGVGAYGVVWLGRGTNKEAVAIKVLHPSAAATPESVERFRREAYTLSQLKSPHIVRMFEFVNDPTYGLALIMEYIEGSLLSERLTERSLSVEDATYLGIDMLRGLVEMHSHGIIHRDLKPENVMLRPIEDGRWRAVIFDFNLSRLKPKGDGIKQSSLTAMGSAIGTVPYMAPEQLLDARRVTEKADIYSVGAMLFRAVAGQAPFPGNASFREKLINEAPIVPTGRTDPSAVGFERVVGRALRRRPQERYDDAPQMQIALESLLARMSRPHF